MISLSLYLPTNTSNGRKIESYYRLQSLKRNIVGNSKCDHIV